MSVTRRWTGGASVRLRSGIEAAGFPVVVVEQGPQYR
ncbi:MAG: hypothetical protein QOJ11_4305 [Frankiales bacterium]|jgi:hypothetical protein|nr:hypothetical protein [Frankiales bacterium]